MNQEDIGEADRYNIASVVNQLSDEHENSTKTSKEFEDFLLQTMGKDWYDNMISAWLKRKSRKMAKNWSCPELADNGNIFIVDPK